MISRVLLVAAVVGAIGSLVTAIVYVNFSARVMPALGRLPAAQGIATMQAFNRTAVQPPFMAAFFGAAIAGVVLVVRLVAGARTPVDVLAAVGGTLYLAGFALTIGGNVPLNDRLAALDANDPTSGAFWATYLVSWTRANSVRAALSVLALLTLVGSTVLALRSARA